MKKKPKPKKPMGRPSDYTAALRDEICARVMLGETIRQVCAAQAMPDERAVYRWLAAHEDFRQQYAHAREESGHVAADGVTEAAEQVRRGSLAPDAGRVVIDALKWAAGKRKPKVYSDKLQISGDPESPIRHEVDVTLSPAEAYARAIKPELA